MPHLCAHPPPCPRCQPLVASDGTHGRCACHVVRERTRRGV